MEPIFDMLINPVKAPVDPKGLLNPFLRRRIVAVVDELPVQTLEDNFFFGVSVTITTDLIESR
jgi:hypothetical protein